MALASWSGHSQIGPIPGNDVQFQVMMLHTGKINKK